MDGKGSIMGITSISSEREFLHMLKVSSGSIVPSLSLQQFSVAHGVLGLPVPQVSAHSFKIFWCLEAQFLLCKTRVGSEVGNIATSSRKDDHLVAINGSKVKRTFCQ